MPIVHFINGFRYRLFRLIDLLTGINVRFFNSMKGIKTGKGCVFRGFPHIVVRDNGHISIGNKCTFNSRECSNLIGLNHRCILAATPAYLGDDALLLIGNDCGFSGVSIWCAKKIIIGNNVRVGANCLITDGDAHYDDPRSNAPKEIVIENNVWIGANCVIKGGVTIGEGSLIGMNSIVTHNIPSNSVAVGYPAKVIRTLN